MTVYQSGISFTSRLDNHSLCKIKGLPGADTRGVSGLPAQVYTQLQIFSLVILDFRSIWKSSMGNGIGPVSPLGEKEQQKIP